MIDLIFTVAFSLFLLMDPVGNIPLFITMLREIPRKRRIWIIFRENLIALFVILLFAYFGKYLIKALDVSTETLYLAGGTVLFLMAIKMIFPINGNGNHQFDYEGEPIIFPIAVPLIAGPAVFAAVMIYAAQIPNSFIVLASILLAWASSTILLLLAASIQHLLDTRAIKALERLMGLILILIAINMFLKGIQLLKL